MSPSTRYRQTYRTIETAPMRSVVRGDDRRSWRRVAGPRRYQNVILDAVVGTDWPAQRYMRLARLRAENAGNGDGVNVLPRSLSEIAPSSTDPGGPVFRERAISSSPPWVIREKCVTGETGRGSLRYCRCARSASQAPRPPGESGTGIPRDGLADHPSARSAHRARAPARPLGLGHDAPVVSESAEAVTTRFQSSRGSPR